MKTFLSLVLITLLAGGCGNHDTNINGSAADGTAVETSIFTSG